MQSNAGREKTIKSRRNREWDEDQRHSRRKEKSLRARRGGRPKDDFPEED